MFVYRWAAILLSAPPSFIVFQQGGGRAGCAIRAFVIGEVMWGATRAVGCMLHVDHSIWQPDAFYPLVCQIVCLPICLPGMYFSSSLAHLHRLICIAPLLEHHLWQRARMCHSADLFNVSRHPPACSSACPFVCLHACICFISRIRACMAAANAFHLHSLRCRGNTKSDTRGFPETCW